MKVGINTYPFLWSESLEESVEIVKNMGFKEIEILTSPPYFPLHEDEKISINEILKIKSQSDVSIHSLNLPGQDINLASPFKEMREFSETQYKKLINIATELETPYVVMPPGRAHPLLPPDFEWLWSKTKPHIENLVEYAAERNVTMLIENVPSLFLQTANDLKFAIDDINHNNFKAIYDVANGFMVEDPTLGIEILKDDIKLIHLSDTTKVKWAHDIVGSGEINFESVYKKLNEINYSGVCILEIIHSNAKDGIKVSLEELTKNNWNIEL